jgi:hypothetical protein
MNARQVMILGQQSSTFCSGPLLSDENLGEYRVIVLDMTGVASELTSSQNPISQITLVRMHNRFGQMNAWVHAGHTLVVLVTGLPDFRIEKAGETRLIANEIFTGIQFQPVSGTQVEYCGPPNGRELLSPYTIQIEYRAILGGPDLRPLFRVRLARPGPMQVVGAFRRRGSGHMIFAPGLSDRIVSATREKYVEALIAFAGTLGTEKASLPAWSGRIWTKDEAAARKEIKRLEDEVTALQNKMATETEVIERASDLKQLIAGTGEAFKDAVAAALVELGLSVVDGPPGRADLLAFNGRDIAVIEAKGLEGSARERDVGQLGRWMADLRVVLSSMKEPQTDTDLSRYAEQLPQLGINVEQNTPPECKGILIIGT